MATQAIGHHHTTDEERRIREAALDKTLADTFPASDPPSTNPNPCDDSALELFDNSARDAAAHTPSRAPRGRKRS